MHKVSWLTDRYGNLIERWQDTPDAPTRIELRVTLNPDRNPPTNTAADVEAWYWKNVGVR